jgi:hypothetical protein
MSARLTPLGCIAIAATAACNALLDNDDKVPSPNDETAPSATCFIDEGVTQRCGSAGSGYLCAPETSPPGEACSPLDPDDAGNLYETIAYCCGTCSTDPRVTSACQTYGGLVGYSCIGAAYPAECGNQVLKIPSADNGSTGYCCGSADMADAGMSDAGADGTRQGDDAGEAPGDVDSYPEDENSSAVEEAEAIASDAGEDAGEERVGADLDASLRDASIPQADGAEDADSTASGDVSTVAPELDAGAGATPDAGTVTSPCLFGATPVNALDGQAPSSILACDAVPQPGTCTPSSSWCCVPSGDTATCSGLDAAPGLVIDNMSRYSNDPNNPSLSCPATQISLAVPIEMGTPGSWYTYAPPGTMLPSISSFGFRPFTATCSVPIGNAVCMELRPSIEASPWGAGMGFYFLTTTLNETTGTSLQVAYPIRGYKGIRFWAMGGPSLPPTLSVVFPFAEGSSDAASDAGCVRGNNCSTVEGESSVPLTVQWTEYEIDFGQFSTPQGADFDDAESPRSAFGIQFELRSGADGFAGGLDADGLDADGFGLDADVFDGGLDATDAAANIVCVANIVFVP